MEYSDEIKKAVKLLEQGQVVGMPTETVYGLAGRIDNETAIHRIFAVKERPFFDPLIVHVSSIAQAKKCTTDWNEMCEVLARKFWPGPLTLVLPKSVIVSDLITSGLPNVGIRWPKHSVAQDLIAACDMPLAAPSANKFGRTSPTTAQHVRDEFGDTVFVLDSEPCEIGIESTVLLVKKSEKLFELSILRKGAYVQSFIDRELENLGLDYKWVEVVDKSSAPGHMKHHYMPSIPLVVCRNPKMTLVELSKLVEQKMAQLPAEIDGVKIIKPKLPIGKIDFLKLSSRPEQAARELYAQLRSVSARKPDLICYIQSSNQIDEMWDSVFDRLYKAASLILD